jgi:hypothetical protein
MSVEGWMDGHMRRRRLSYYIFIIFAYCVQCCIAALYTVSFVHGCFVGKCILTGSTEYSYFKVDGSMEKKRNTVIPADLKRLFVSGTYMSRWSPKS